MDTNVESTCLRVQVFFVKEEDAFSVHHQRIKNLMKNQIIILLLSGGLTMLRMRWMMDTNVESTCKSQINKILIQNVKLRDNYVKEGFAYNVGGIHNLRIIICLLC